MKKKSDLWVPRTGKGKMAIHCRSHMSEFPNGEKLTE